MLHFNVELWNTIISIIISILGIFWDFIRNKAQRITTNGVIWHTWWGVFERMHLILFTWGFRCTWVYLQSITTMDGDKICSPHPCHPSYTYFINHLFISYLLNLCSDATFTWFFSWLRLYVLWTRATQKTNNKQQQQQNKTKQKTVALVWPHYRRFGWKRI